MDLNENGTKRHESNFEEGHENVETTRLAEDDLNRHQGSTKALPAFQHHIKEEVVDNGESYGSIESNFYTEGTRLNERPSYIKAECGLETNECEDLSTHASHVSRKPSRIVYRCKYCGQQLQKLSSLQKHEDAHRDGSIYKCRYCEYYSLQRDRIGAHERKHTGEKPFSCDKCDYRCAAMGDLKKHERTHFHTRPYSCKLCPFRCKWSGGIKHHMLSHSDNRPFCCNVCGDGFKTKYVLENHMKLHSSEKGFFCDKCNYTCRTRNLLSLHSKTHSDVKNFACSHPGCPQRCKTRSDLVKHMSVHATTLDFKCVICAKQFKCRHSLRCHTRRHEKLEFPCDTCGKILSSKNGLKLHLSLHIGKRFECQICGHRSSTAHNLKMHLRVHDESRTFRCPLCVYAFENVNHLFTHIGYAHGKDYVYFCEKCHKPFSRYLMIKTHIDRNHRDGEDISIVYEFAYNNECWAESKVLEQKFAQLLNERNAKQKENEATSLAAEEACEDSKPLLTLLSTVDSLPVQELVVNCSFVPQSDSQHLGYTPLKNELVTGITGDNQNTNGGNGTDLGNRELTIKLERLSENFDFEREEEGPSISVKPNAEENQIVSEPNFDKIIRLGTYANVGINLAGKDSGIKFSLKRGKKSANKWFMDPSNMTQDAAKKTKEYLTKQAKLTRRNGVSKRKRRNLSGKVSVVEEQFDSISISKPRRGRPPKKKLRLNGGDRRACAKKKSTSFAEEVTAVKLEPQDDLCQVSEQNDLCYQQQKSESSLDIEERSCQNREGTEIDVELDQNSSCFDQPAVVEVEEKQIPSGRKKRLSTGAKKRQIKSKKSSKRMRLLTKSKAGTTLELLDEGIESFSVPNADVDSEVMADRRCELSGIVDGLLVSSKEEAGGSRIQSDVLEVENIIDSPFQITWKKVGGSRSRNNKRELVQDDMCSVLHEGENYMEDVQAAEEKTEILSSEHFETLISKEENCDILKCNHENDGLLSPNQKSEKNETDVSSPIQTEYSINETESLKCENIELSPNKDFYRSSTKRSIQILSLKEFEEEYRRRPKITANISVTGSEITDVPYKRRRENSVKKNKRMKNVMTKICDKVTKEKKKLNNSKRKVSLGDERESNNMSYQSEQSEIGESSCVSVERKISDQESNSPEPQNEVIDAASSEEFGKECKKNPKLVLKISLIKERKKRKLVPGAGKITTKGKKRTHKGEAKATIVSDGLGLISNNDDEEMVLTTGFHINGLSSDIVSAVDFDEDSTPTGNKVDNNNIEKCQRECSNQRNKRGPKSKRKTAIKCSSFVAADGNDALSLAPSDMILENKKKGRKVKVLKSNAKSKTKVMERNKLKVSSLFQAVIGKKKSPGLQASIMDGKGNNSKKKVGRKRVGSPICVHEQGNIGKPTAVTQPTVSNVTTQSYISDVMNQEVPISNLAQQPLTTMDQVEMNSNVAIVQSSKIRSNSKHDKSMTHSSSIEQSPISDIENGSSATYSSSKAKPPKERIKRPKVVKQGKIHPIKLKFSSKTVVNTPDKQNDILGTKHCSQSPAVSSSSKSKKSAPETTIKLPGLTSEDLTERRMTVECVTQVPKVLLRHTPISNAVGYYNYNNPCPHPPSEANHQMDIGIGVHSVGEDIHQMDIGAHPPCEDIGEGLHPPCADNHPVDTGVSLHPPSEDIHQVDIGVYPPLDQGTVQVEVSCQQEENSIVKMETIAGGGGDSGDITLTQLEGLPLAVPSFIPGVGVADHSEVNHNCVDSKDDVHH